ncbi:MAG: hypothetical protein ACTSWN_00865 [Promethearchaeota archaeon]
MQINLRNGGIKAFTCMQCGNTIRNPLYFLRKCKKCGLDLCLDCYSHKHKFHLCAWCYQKIPGKYIYMLNVSRIFMFLAPFITLFFPGPAPLVMLFFSNLSMILWWGLHTLLFIFVLLVYRIFIRMKAIKSIILDENANATGNAIKELKLSADVGDLIFSINDDGLIPLKSRNSLDEDPLKTSRGLEMPETTPASKSSLSFEDGKKLMIAGGNNVKNIENNLGKKVPITEKPPIEFSIDGIAKKSKKDEEPGE